MKKINYRITGTTSRSLLGACLVSVFMFFSCARENNVTPQEDNRVGNNLNLDTRAVPAAVAANARIYMFTGVANSLGNYNHQILNITRTVNDLKMIAQAGTWDIVLVSAETASDLNNVIAPTVGTAGGSQKMFELAPMGGNLPSAPDILTAYIDEQVVVANTDNTASTSFAHTMAQVRLTIKDAKGLNTAQPHTISLGNVPTTIAWDGKLLPSKTAPTVSSTKMTGSVTVSDVAGGVQESNTLTFLVPAHRGTDFLATNPNDTTTSKLTVSVNLPLSGGGNYVKSDVEIRKVPKAGKILDVTLLIQGALEIQSDILDWTEIGTNIGLSNTTLQVSKTNVGLSSVDSLIVKTNATTGYTVAKDPAGTWFTATTSGERIVINATTSNYTAPRSSWIDITANNVTKRVKINQRPDVGTITVSQSPIWMSPSTGNTTRTITVNSTGSWTTTSGTLANATQNVTSGNAGNTNVTFTRKFNAIDNGDYTMYGPQTWTIRNSSTLETISVVVDNYFMLADDIYAGNANHTITSSNIDIHGGTGLFTVDASPRPVWITAASCLPNGDISITTLKDPDEEAREGYLTITHNGDPTYKIQVKVIQDIVVTIPPFDFFVLKYEWAQTSGYDVDIATEFAGNGATFDRAPVGWNLSQTVNYNSNLLLQWGGDARNGEGETAFFNAPVIENVTTLPRMINLETYSTWYNPQSQRGQPMVFTMTAYKGGVMQKGPVTGITGSNSYNYYNIGGVKLYEQTFKVRINTYQGVGSFRTGGYEHVATITYDRIKHSAKVVIHATIVASMPTEPPLVVPFSRSGDIEYKPVTTNVINTYSIDYWR